MPPIALSDARAAAGRADAPGVVSAELFSNFSSLVPFHGDLNFCVRHAHRAAEITSLDPGELVCICVQQPGHHGHHPTSVRGEVEPIRPSNVTMADRIDRLLHLLGRDQVCAVAGTLPPPTVGRVSETLVGGSVLAAGGVSAAAVDNTSSVKRSGRVISILTAATAWNHWINTTLQPGTDRRVALLHLDALAKAFPVLDDASRREFREALRLTVQPGKGTPGSAEALIDGLTDLPDNEPETFSKSRENAPDYVRLGQMGFAAIPALIAHVDDPRLTRLRRTAPTDARYIQAFLKKQGRGRVSLGPETMTRVGDLVSPLVYQAGRR